MRRQLVLKEGCGVVVWCGVVWFGKYTHGGILHLSLVLLSCWFDHTIKLHCCSLEGHSKNETWWSQFQFPVNSKMSFAIDNCVPQIVNFQIPNGQMLNAKCTQTKQVPYALMHK